MSYPIKVLKSAKCAKGCHCERRENRKVVSDIRLIDFAKDQLMYWKQKQSLIFPVETLPFTDDVEDWWTNNARQQEAKHLLCILIPYLVGRFREGMASFFRYILHCIPNFLFWMHVESKSSCLNCFELIRPVPRLNLVYLPYHIALSMLPSSWRFWEM